MQRAASTTAVGARIGGGGSGLEQMIMRRRYWHSLSGSRSANATATATEHQRRLLSFESFFQKQQPPTQQQQQRQEQQPQRSGESDRSIPSQDNERPTVDRPWRGASRTPPPSFTSMSSQPQQQPSRGRHQQHQQHQHDKGGPSLSKQSSPLSSNSYQQQQQQQPQQQSRLQQQSKTMPSRGNIWNNSQLPAPPEAAAGQMTDQRRRQPPPPPPPRPPWSLRVDENLQDITQLREAFTMKKNGGTRGGTGDSCISNNEQRNWGNSNNNYSNNSNRNSSNNNYSASSSSPRLLSSPVVVGQVPGAGAGTGAGTDSLAADVGVGTRWRPTLYKKNPPGSTTPQPSSSSSHPLPPPRTSMQQPSYHELPPPPPPTPSAANHSDGNVGGGGVKSMEQVMRENAMKQQRNMEQRYNNAGQQVPHNSDAFGNSIGGSPSSSQSFTWRNQNHQQHQQQQGRGGWQQRQSFNNNNYRRQPQQQQQQQTRQERQRKQIRKYLPPSTPTEVRLPTSSPLSLVDLSLLLRVRKRTIVRTLRSLGGPIAYTTANQDTYTIDLEMMELICIELGIEPLRGERRKESDVEVSERRALRTAKEDEDVQDELYATLPPRSPVISVMGHVDHGKTTLMDALRRRAVTNTPSKGGGTTTGKAEKKKKMKNNGESSQQQQRKGGVDTVNGDVAGTEAGGITQVITAFEVPLPLLDEGVTLTDDDDGLLSSHHMIKTVTFLDTPGHAAFKKMRHSGSLATDVIVLVVAADDGVSPQTIEIIEMYKSIARAQPQSISLVIAVSKIDKPGIDVDEAVMRIENQLMEHDLFTENVVAGGGVEGEFGSCQLFPVSGITGEGLDDLVEGLALQAEIMDLRADENAMGEGIVIDARMERGLGVVADCIIRWGSVSRGDFVVSGTHGGRVKFLYDVGNKTITKARPSQPVRIVGFKTLPKAGDPVVCAKSEDEAKELIRLRESELINEERAEYEKNMTLQVTGTAAKQGGMMQKAQQKYGFNGDDADEKNDSIYIPVVIKADSHGSLEAVRDALVSLGTGSKLDIVIDPVEMSTGVITASDVMMARESDAAIFSFGKVGFADKETKNLAESDGVSVRSHDIVYRLLEDATDFFAKYLPILLEEKVHGKGLVMAVFDVTDAKKQTVSIAGLRVTDGYIFKAKSKAKSNDEESLHCFYRVLRDGKLLKPEVQKLQASSLRKVKDDVDSVRKGEECGLGLIGFNDLEEGDVVECFSIEEKRAVI